MAPAHREVGGDAGFQSDNGNNIVFLSPIDGSEFGDLDYYEPVTEISDSELERLGFPVPTEQSPSAGGGGFGSSGSGGLGYPHGVIESPFIHFTSREYLIWRPFFSSTGSIAKCGYQRSFPSIVLGLSALSPPHTDSVPEKDGVRLC